MAVVCNDTRISIFQLMVETMNREKGKRGKTLANKLKEYGYDCRRGCQYNGADGMRCNHT